MEKLKHTLKYLIECWVRCVPFSYTKGTWRTICWHQKPILTDKIASMIELTIRDQNWLHPSSQCQARLLVYMPTSLKVPSRLWLLDRLWCFQTFEKTCSSRHFCIAYLNISDILILAKGKGAPSIWNISNGKGLIPKIPSLYTGLIPGGTAIGTFKVRFQVLGSRRGKNPLMFLCSISGGCLAGAIIPCTLKPPFK